MDWIVVVPVKPAAAGKTRLAGLLSPDARVALVRAMALDTIDAARETPGVTRVVVVTADAQVRAAVADVVDEPVAAAGPEGGLNAAVRAGVARARVLDPDAGVAVLLGDLPALRPADLADVLVAAAGHARAVVADAGGTGTTVLTAGPGVGIEPRFGVGSAAAHEAGGHVRLDVASASSVRRDVDVPDDLAEVARLGVGPRTRAVLSGAPVDQG